MCDPYSHRPRVGITLSYRVGGDPHTPACDPHLPPCAPLRAHWSVRVRPSIAFLLCRPPCLPALSPSLPACFVPVLCVLLLPPSAPLRATGPPACVPPPPHRFASVAGALVVRDRLVYRVGLRRSWGDVFGGGTRGATVVGARPRGGGGQRGDRRRRSALTRTGVHPGSGGSRAGAVGSPDSGAGRGALGAMAGHHGVGVRGHDHQRGGGRRGSLVEQFERRHHGPRCVGRDRSRTAERSGTPRRRGTAGRVSAVVGGRAGVQCTQRSGPVRYGRGRRMWGAVFSLARAGGARPRTAQIGRAHV